jgi:UDP-glucose 4-epimerase
VKVLVTGANGFLGRAVVGALASRGHQVRAMVRPAACIEGLGWTDGNIEIFRADLRASSNLVEAFAGVDMLVHLAAAVTGDEDHQFSSTVVGTERLLDAMAQSATRSMVLASSYSVYDWSAAGSSITEDTPQEADLYTRDGYAIAKVWQERLTRRYAEAHGWNLIVMRPGFIWGRGNAFVPGLGQQMGPATIIVAPRARLPLTYVVNCADAFAVVVDKADKARGQVFNVVDGFDISSWRFAGEYLKRTGTRSRRIPLPYWVGRAISTTINGVSRLLFKGEGKLPSIVVPVRYEARFKPVASDYRNLRALGWTPPLTLSECLAQTYSAPPGARVGISNPDRSRGSESK